MMISVAFLLSVLGQIHIDEDGSVFRDQYNRTLIWHGTNFVEKGAPYYPTISAADKDAMVIMGFKVVRLGVMMPGLFPVSLEPNATYLDEIERIVDDLWSIGIHSILDLHQDVLSPVICGEGTPSWMLNTSQLRALNFPQPLVLSPSFKPDPATGGWQPGVTCSPEGVLKFIGWSEFYMTDACGKAFQQIYDEKSTLGAIFPKFWSTVAQRFKGKKGVLAYELLNEPWVGDHVKHPDLLLEAGVAEKQNLAGFMTRIHDVIRAEDPDTLTLYAPAEINNRAMRRVGYEEGFLPGEPMAFHVYCLTGTDGDGPTTPFTKELCKFNDGDQIGQRSSDLRRLRTAGFITEFGAVSAKPTGLGEVLQVLDSFDAGSSGTVAPFSWCFWAGIPADGTPYRRELARAYPHIVAGTVLDLSFDNTTSAFSLRFHSEVAVEEMSTSEVIVPVLRYGNSSRWVAGAKPDGCCALDARSTPGVLYIDVLSAPADGVVTVTVSMRP
jgi:endoglycosylceramidase